MFFYFTITRQIFAKDNLLVILLLLFLNNLRSLFWYILASSIFTPPPPKKKKKEKNYICYRCAEASALELARTDSSFCLKVQFSGFFSSNFADFPIHQPAG